MQSFQEKEVGEGKKLCCSDRQEKRRENPLAMSGNDQMARVRSASNLWKTEDLMNKLGGDLVSKDNLMVGWMTSYKIRSDLYLCSYLLKSNSSMRYHPETVLIF